MVAAAVLVDIGKDNSTDNMVVVAVVGEVGFHFVFLLWPSRFFGENEL